MASGKEENPFDFWRILFLSLLLSGAVPVAFQLLVRQFSPVNAIWLQVAAHSAMEAIGAVLAVSVGGLVLTLWREDQQTPRGVWIGCALLASGILDTFHAFLEPGNRFVWFRTLSTFLGAVFFMMAWISELFRIKSDRRVVAPIVFLVSTFAIGGLLFQDRLPRMVFEGEFTGIAVTLNSLAGLLYLFSAGILFRNFRREGRRPDILFANYCLLLAVADFSFQGSRLWDFPWWGWHFLRLSAYFVILVILIDYFRSIQKELGELNQQLRAAVKARDEFLLVASHELKTPLTPLKLQIQLLKRSLAQQSETAGQFSRGLDVSNQQVDRLTRLVEGLLDVSRAEVGKLVMDFQSGDLAKVVREVVEDFGEQARQSGCEVSVEAPETLPGVFDRLRMEQVLSNLLTNAFRYAPGGKVRIRLEGDLQRVVLFFEDKGPGIAQEALPRVFDRFAGFGESAKFGGLGLGLYVSRRIIEAHGGEISVESEVGKGACFRVELPLYVRSEEKISSLD